MSSVLEEELLPQQNGTQNTETKMNGSSKNKNMADAEEEDSLGELESNSSISIHTALVTGTATNGHSAASSIANNLDMLASSRANGFLALANSTSVAARARAGRSSIVASISR